MIRVPPRSPLFPYTPLFRSRIAELRARYGEDAEVELREVSCLGRFDGAPAVAVDERPAPAADAEALDRKSTRLNSSHANISYAVFCLKKKKKLLSASNKMYQ